MKRILKIAAIALIPLAGCVSAPDGMEIARGECEAVPRVQTEDRFFRKWVTVEDASALRHNGGFLAAAARVRNGSPEDVYLQYKFRWFDASGVEVQPDGRAWEQTVIHAGDVATLSATAPDMSVVRFTLRIRRSI